jgi:hypothetical protein
MLSKANRDKVRTVLTATDPGGVLHQALDAIDALEAERDALAAQVAQHERGVASWLAEEALWKEREAALATRAAELEAALDTIAELSLDSWSRDTARKALEGAGDAREGQP